MTVSQTADYALRAVVWLAQHRGQPQTAPRLAEATGVPCSYLPKVLQPLIRGGLLSAQRGLHGGYALVRDPTGLSVLDVINCVDPMPRIHACPLGLGTHHAELCPLHRLLDSATMDAERRFAEAHIDDLIPPASVTDVILADLPDSSHNPSAVPDKPKRATP